MRGSDEEPTSPSPRRVVSSFEPVILHEASVLDRGIREVADDQPGSRRRLLNACLGERGPRAVKEPLGQWVEALDFRDPLREVVPVEDLVETGDVAAPVADDVLLRWTRCMVMEQLPRIQSPRACRRLIDQDPSVPDCLEQRLRA